MKPQLIFVLVLLAGGCSFEGATYTATSSTQSVSIKKSAVHPPDLHIAVALTETSEAGVLEAGEHGHLHLSVSNEGKGKASNLGFEITPAIQSGLNYPVSETLGDIAAGDSRVFDIPIAASADVKDQRVSLSIAFQEENGFAPSSTGLSFLTRAGVDSKIPQAGKENPNGVALILSISDYQTSGIPKVEYAKNDAEAIRQYLVKAFGFKPQNILPAGLDEKLTYGRIQTYIKSILPSYLKPDGSSDLFIYYTGHGAPGAKNHDAYLVPWDGDPNFVNDNNAYSMKTFYTDIEKLPARHKIVVVDACFSGHTGSGASLLRNASPIYLKVNNPLIADSNTVIFQSSGADQMSNWYNEKHHGMFTYFFLRGLQGEADDNHDGTIDADELVKYINNQNDGLPYWSNRLYQRPQEAQLEGNREMIIERIEK